MGGGEVAGIVADVGAVAGEGEDGGSGGSGGEGGVVEGGGGSGEADKGVREDAVGPVDGGVVGQRREEEFALHLQVPQLLHLVAPPPGSLCRWCCDFRRRGRR